MEEHVHLHSVCSIHETLGLNKDREGRREKREEEGMEEGRRMKKMNLYLFPCISYPSLK